MMYGQKSKLDLDSLRVLAENHAVDIDQLVFSLRSGLQPLLVCLSHSWGGLEQVTAYDSLDLAAIGLNPRVLCIQGSPIHQSLSLHPEIQIIPLEFVPRNYFDLKLKAELQKLIRGGVILIHTHQTSLMGSISPWLWNHRQVAFFATRHMMNNHIK